MESHVTLYHGPHQRPSLVEGPAPIIHSHTLRSDIFSLSLSFSYPLTISPSSSFPPYTPKKFDCSFLNFCGCLPPKTFAKPSLCSRGWCGRRRIRHTFPFEDRRMTKRRRRNVGTRGIYDMLKITRRGLRRRRQRKRRRRLLYHSRFVQEELHHLRRPTQDLTNGILPSSPTDFASPRFGKQVVLFEGGESLSVDRMDSTLACSVQAFVVLHGYQPEHKKYFKYQEEFSFHSVLFFLS